MNSERTSKKDIYKAVGYTALLVALAIPFAILGLQVLNFVLRNVKVWSFSNLSRQFWCLCCRDSPLYVMANQNEQNLAADKAKDKEFFKINDIL